MKPNLKNNLFRLGVLVAGLQIGACASITSMTTAKTLKDGQSEKAVAVGYSNLKLKTDAGDTSTTAPGVDLAWRYGLTDDDEVGVRLANLAYLIGDYKRAIIKGSDFGLSLGAGIGGTHYSIGNDSYTIFDLYVPTVYLDWYASDEMTVFMAPKLIYRVSSGSGSQKFAQMALSGGVKWGKESGVIL
jgi:hypothetical protein